jgi:hypothetical protein
MGDDIETCSRCGRSFIEVDRHGERLIGCIECNRGGWPGGHDLPREVSEEDLRALQKPR